MKTSPNDPLPTRSSFVNKSSGSTPCHRHATKVKHNGAEARGPGRAHPLYLVGRRRHGIFLFIFRCSWALGDKVTKSFYTYSCYWQKKKKIKKKTRHGVAVCDHPRVACAFRPGPRHGGPRPPSAVCAGVYADRDQQLNHRRPAACTRAPSSYPTAPPLPFRPSPR